MHHAIFRFTEAHLFVITTFVPDTPGCRVERVPQPVLLIVYTENTMQGHDKNNRGIQRYPITVKRDCNLGVITFNELEWSDHVAQIVDISVIGLGIVSQQRLEPGLVWFKSHVGGFKSGVLMWSKQEGSAFRAGIRFVPLSREEETYLQEQVQKSRPSQPLRDPHQIISSMLDSIQKERSGLY